MPRIPKALEGVTWLTDEHFLTALIDAEKTNQSVHYFITRTSGQINGANPDFAAVVAKGLKLDKPGDKRNDFKRRVGTHFYEYAKSWSEDRLHELDSNSKTAFDNKGLDTYLDLLATAVSIDRLALLIKPGALERSEDFLETAKHDFGKFMPKIKPALGRAIEKLDADCKLLPQYSGNAGHYIGRLVTIDQNYNDLHRDFGNVFRRYDYNTAEGDDFSKRLAPVENRISKLKSAAVITYPGLTPEDWSAVSIAEILRRQTGQAKNPSIE